MTTDGASNQARSGAPFDDAGVRARYQQVRAGFGVLVLALGIGGLLLGAPGSVLKIPAGLVLLTDATLRFHRSGDLRWSLVVDAVVSAITVGFGDVYLPALTAVIGYLLTTAVLFTGATRAAVLVPLGVGVGAVRSVFVPLFVDGSVPGGAEPLVWTEAGLYLVALVLTLGSGAAVMRQVRERQAAALAAERRASQMKNQFVSMVTHELRTPLTNIAGFALTVQEAWRSLDPEEVDEFLGIVVGEAEHLQHLVDDVLAIPRLEAGRLVLDVTDFALQPAAYRIADLTFPAGGEKSASVAVAGNVVVHADPNRVEQILRNLLENALKHGGSQVSVEADRDGDHYVVAVTDDGPGVPEEHRHRVFEAFEQVRDEDGQPHVESGFGLGLAVAKHLVEAMGGSIWYEPVFPVGARFSFTLPAGRAEQRSAPTPRTAVG